MFFFFFKQRTAYEMRISDWSSDVCSSDLKTFVSLMLVAEAAGRVATFLVMSVVMKPTARVLIYSSIVAFAIEFLIIIAYAARRIPFGTQGDPFEDRQSVV